MRLVRVSSFILLLVLALVLAFAATANAATSHTYRVWVGGENVRRGVDVMAFFPSSVKVHEGDTVHWVQHANEIHTVTFLGGQTAPDLLVPAASLGLPDTPSPLVFNPKVSDAAPATGGLGDTTTWVNSGIMGRAPGQVRAFDVRFTATGSYPYLCLVHGQMMSGTVTVVPAGQRIAPPQVVRAKARVQLAHMMAKAPAVMRAARAEIKPATTNADGSKTHYVAVGFHKGRIDLMRFIPRRLAVKPGDTVVWEMRASNDAPHTVTFLNGAAEPGLVIPVMQQTGPPVLYIDPAVLLPQLPTPDLTRTGMYSSGIMNPVPGTTFTLKIGADVSAGPLRYECLLHDASGMTARLIVGTR